MNQTSLVSIALCTYNGAAFIKEQLTSIIKQTHSNLEIIIVDDGSTDDTVKFVKDFCTKDNRIHLYINEKNLGYVKNFEKAIGFCKGDYIALSDQDDVWEPTKIETQLSSLGDNVLVYHDSEFIDEHGNSMSKKMSDIMHLYRGKDPEPFLFFNSVSGHTILMKRQVAIDAMPFKEGYFHDWWLAYVAVNTGGIACIDKPLVKYRQHKDSDTDVLRNKKITTKQSSLVKLQRIQQWLQYCAEFPRNKKEALVKNFSTAFAERMKSYVSFSLSILLFKHREKIFAIRKKSKINTLNYIYSQIWGAKAKAIFGNK